MQYHYNIYPLSQWEREAEEFFKLVCEIAGTEGYDIATGYAMPNKECLMQSCEYQRDCNGKEDPECTKLYEKLASDCIFAGKKIEEPEEEEKEGSDDKKKDDEPLDIAGCEKDKDGKFLF